GIRGKVDANGIEGDLELQSIDGETVDAIAYKGQVTAREVRSPVVRLRAVSGTIIYVGPIVVGGRYELTAVDGDIRMTLRPLPFRVVAQAPRGNIVAADFALDGLQ